MKKGIQETIQGMMHVIRWPSTGRAAMVHTGMWSLAGLFACVGIVSSFLGERWGWAWFNAGILVVDLYMLRLSILGIGYRRSRRGKTSRRALP